MRLNAIRKKERCLRRKDAAEDAVFEEFAQLVSKEWQKLKSRLAALTERHGHVKSSGFRLATNEAQLWQKHGCAGAAPVVGLGGSGSAGQQPGPYKHFVCIVDRTR